MHANRFELLRRQSWWNLVALAHHLRFKAHSLAYSNFSHACIGADYGSRDVLTLTKLIRTCNWVSAIELQVSFGGRSESWTRSRLSTSALVFETNLLPFQQSSIKSTRSEKVVFHFSINWCKPFLAFDLALSTRFELVFLTLKGWCPRPLDDESKMAGYMGIEPITLGWQPSIINRLTNTPNMYRTGLDSCFDFLCSEIRGELESLASIRFVSCRKTKNSERKSVFPLLRS